MRLALACVVSLLFAGEAQAVTAPQVARQVAGFDADVACLNDTDWQTMLATHGLPAASNGLTWIAERRVRLAPWVCHAIENRTVLLGSALNVVAHESAHLRGVTDEAVAACWGLVWVADLARRFYAVEFFTPGSDEMQARSLRLHRSLPAEYRVVCS